MRAAFLVGAVQVALTMHDFHIDDGWRVVGGVTLGSDGKLYGTAAQGGTGSCFNGCGVVWQITP